MKIESDTTLKDYGDEKEHVPIKDCEDKYDVLDHGSGDKLVSAKYDGEGEEPTLSLKDNEDGDNRDILLKDHGGSDEADAIAKEPNVSFRDCGGGDKSNGLHLKDLVNQEKPIVSSRDHEDVCESNVLKDHKDVNEFDTSSKSFVSENLLDSFLEDQQKSGGDLDVLSQCRDELVTFGDYQEKDEKKSDDLLEGAKEPDGHSQHSNDGKGSVSILKNQNDDKHDILLENHGSRDEAGVTQKNFGNKNDSELPLKDPVYEKNYILLENHGGSDKVDVNSKGFGGGNSPNLSLKDCEVREKYDVLLDDYGGGDKLHSHLKEPDVSSRNFEQKENLDVYLENLEGAEKHDVSSRNFEQKDNLDVLLENLEGAEESDVHPQKFDGGKEPVSIKRYQNGRDKHDVHSNKTVATSEDHEVKNDLHALLRDLEGRDESVLPSKDHESRDEHSATTFISSETEKVSKNSWKKKCHIQSACLYQAYLNMINGCGKTRNTDLLPEKNIQSFNIGKNNTIRENDETFIAKSHQPIPLQKKSNEKQFPRKFSRNQSYHKKAVLRRDLLAESSEEFLSILHSARCSKESDKNFYRQRKLDRNGPSSCNEMYKSRDVINHLTPFSNEPFEFSLKRKAETVLSSSYRIPKKRRIDSQHLEKIQNIHDFQVVIMRDSRGTPMRKVDLDEVQHLLNGEVVRFILDEKSHFIPRFFGFRVDQNHKWLILNCKDWDTMKWVLNWKLLNTNHSFTIVKSEKAPWRTIRICFNIRREKPEVKKIVKLLASQNRMLNVTDWSHVKITGHCGEWTLYFLLTVNESKQLDDVGWVMFFELGMLQVLKL